MYILLEIDNYLKRNNAKQNKLSSFNLKLVILLSTDTISTLLRLFNKVRVDLKYYQSKT